MLPVVGENDDLLMDAWVSKIKVGIMVICLVVLNGLNALLSQSAHIDLSYENSEREYFLFRAVESAKNLIDKGETLKVLKKCNDALDSLTPGSDSKYQGHLLNYKGSVYLRMGNYYLSEKCFNLAQAYGDKFHDKDLNGSSINNLGGLALVAKEYAKAANIFQQLLDPRSIIFDESLRISAKMNLAELAILEKDTAAGKILFYYLTQLQKRSDTYLLERNMGRFQMMLNNTAKAIPYLKRALAKSIAVNGQNHYQTGLCYFHLGECYHKMGIRDSAGICYNEATQIFSSRSINSVIGEAEVLPQYETVLIECLIKQGEFYSERSSTLLAAFEKYTAAINRLLYLSHAITAESTRFIIAEKGRSAFNKGIACALKLFDLSKDNRYLDQAFEWSLQSKSLSLNWLVEKDLIYARVGIPFELTEKLQAYRKNLDELLGDSLDFVVHVPLDSIGRVIRLYEETEKQIRIKYDEIRKGIAADPVSRRITEKNFNKEQYLGYYDLDSLIIVFGVTLKGRSYIRIPKDSLLIAQINRFKEILAIPPQGVYGSKEVSAFSNLSSYLYEKLLRPALNGSERGNLAIHPDGILLGFPFEALTTTKAVPDTYKGLPFLMNRFQIRYLSTSMLIGPKHKHGLKRDAISIITCKDAVNIPDVAKEVTRIAEMYRHPSIWYLDQQQSNTLFNDTSVIIHISSHLSVNNQDPLMSGIYCQKTGVPGLTFKEILNYQLSGSQVFINACESGNGPVNHGEGLMSLGLAFSIAGCSTIIQQVWNAPDHSSMQIAQSYYKFLGKLCPADAITRAKKEYLRSAKPGSDHPYYWAGMICYSNISGRSWFPQMLIPILIVLILGVCIYWFRRKRN